MAKRKKKKTFAVIGLDSFGIAITEELKDLGIDVTVVDKKEENLNPVIDIADFAAFGDITSETVLDDLGLSHVDHAIISLDDFEDTILITLILHDMGIPQITVKVASEYQEKIAYKVGASFAVFPNRSTGMRIARKLISSNILDYYDIDDQYGVYELKVNGMRYDNIPLKDTDIRNKFGVNIVVIKRGISTFIPGGDDFLAQGDIIITVGTHETIAKFQDTLND